MQYKDIIGNMKIIGFVRCEVQLVDQIWNHKKEGKQYQIKVGGNVDQIKVIKDYKSLHVRQIACKVDNKFSTLEVQ